MFPPQIVVRRPSLFGLSIEEKLQRIIEYLLANGKAEGGNSLQATTCGCLGQCRKPPVHATAYVHAVDHDGGLRTDHSMEQVEEMLAETI